MKIRHGSTKKACFSVRMPGDHPLLLLTSGQCFRPINRIITSESCCCCCFSFASSFAVGTFALSGKHTHSHSQVDTVECSHYCTGY